MTGAIQLLYIYVRNKISLTSSFLLSNSFIRSPKLLPSLCSPFHYCRSDRRLRIVCLYARIADSTVRRHHVGNYCVIRDVRLDTGRLFQGRRVSILLLPILPCCSISELKRKEEKDENEFLCRSIRREIIAIASCIRIEIVRFRPIIENSEDVEVACFQWDVLYNVIIRISIHLVSITFFSFFSFWFVLGLNERLTDDRSIVA